MMTKTVFVTGGAGFIGSALVRYIIQYTSFTVINIDKLTYASNLAALNEVQHNPRYHLSQTDIVDKKVLDNLFKQYNPCGVLHLAAESHVDRSIDGPAAFIKTNIEGTYQLLEAARQYWEQLPQLDQSQFKFLHVSTDEVYGDLHDQEGFFSEKSPYHPSSPYSASKAASDHLVQAWHRTYGLPTIISHSSNNYGPFQHPEKLIPLMISHCLQGKNLPVYGQGQQIRDWIYVEDHVRALWCIFTQATTGQTYTVGANNEQQNLQLVKKICHLLDELYSCQSNPNTPQLNTYEELIHFVKDRPGHDFRYAIDASKLRHDLAWTPQESFETGLRKTVQWYLANYHATSGKKSY